MVGQIFDDVRRILLGLLFFVAFGWMAAQVLPGQGPATVASIGGQQVAQLDVTGGLMSSRP